MEDYISFNKLVVSGSKNSMNEFYDVLESDMDFQMGTFHPIPEELSNTEFPNEFQPFDKKEVVSKQGKTTLVDVDELGRTEKEFKTHISMLVKGYGFDNWYDWCITNWGCIGEVDDQCESDDCNEKYYSVNYMTIGGPNIIFVKFLSELYPNLSFTLDYRSEDKTGGTLKISPGCFQLNIRDYNVLYFGHESNTMKYIFLYGNENPYDNICAVNLLGSVLDQEMIKKGIKPENVENWDKVIEYFNFKYPFTSPN